MTRNIRVLFGMVVAAAESGNYLEVSRAMTRVADYSEKMFMGQPEPVVAASKEYIDAMRASADKVIKQPVVALEEFKTACGTYATDVLIPWLKQEEVEVPNEQRTYNS